MKAKYLIPMVAVLLILVAAYFFFIKKGKTDYAKTIVKYGGSDNYAMLITFDEPYLKAWSKAIAAGKPIFEYNGENYNCSGGTKVK